MIVPWIRIAAVLFVYIAFALLASWAARRAGLELKEMEGRTSSGILFLGAVTNLGILAVTLLFLILVDRRPVSVLGLAFGARDVVFTALGLAATFGGAMLFVWSLRGAGRNQVARRRGSMAGLGPALAVLVVVALMEEVLFRGYIGLNLLPGGPILVVLASAILFTLIHFLTNRVTASQVAGWFLGGVLFAWVYLVTGSIWTAVLLHFAVDATNVLVFDVVGRLSLFSISPKLTDTQRMVFRVAYVVAVVALLTGMYGTTVRLAG